MNAVTAKQLKQKTGEIIKRVRAGEELTVTYRGKPVALITPSKKEPDRRPNGASEFEQAWDSVETTLRETAPPFQGWREATEWVRKRI